MVCDGDVVNPRFNFSLGPIDVFFGKEDSIGMSRLNSKGHRCFRMMRRMLCDAS